MKKVTQVLMGIVVVLAATAPSWAWGHCAASGAGMGACPPPPPGSGGMVPPLLLCLAAGYAVLALAANQARRLSLVGLVLGWFIIAVSAAGLLCMAGKRLCGRCHSEAAVPGGACPWMSANMDKSICKTAENEKAAPVKK